MSIQVGSLLINMEANIARLDQNMREAKTTIDRHMRDVKSVVASVRNAFVALGGAWLAADFFRDAVRVRSALDDLGDTLGDNIKLLDGLRRQAYISGVELDQVGGAATKLARNLNNADDEGQAAAQALKAIGLSVESIRALKPAEAMLEIAKALNKFEDGAGKVAVANALMGKEGAKMLPLLKDMAEAGELQGKITAEQAAKAEKLEKEWRKLNLAWKDTKDGLVEGLIPGLTQLYEITRKLIELGGGGMGALRLFMSEPMGLAFKPMRERINATDEEIARLNRTERGLMTRVGEAPGLAGGLAKEIERVRYDLDLARQRREVYAAIERQQALEGRTGPQFLDARDLRALRKDPLDPGKLGGKGDRDKALSDAQIAKMTAESWEAFNEEVRKGIVALQEFEAEGRKAIEEHNKKLQAEGIAGWIKLAETIEDASDSMVYTWDKFGNRLQITREQWKEMETEAERAGQFARDLGLTFTSAFEDAIVGGKGLREVLRGLEQDILRIVTRKLVTEPFGNAISTAVQGTDFFKAVTGFFSGVFAGGKAEGGPVWGGTPYLVGERGPELFVPRQSGNIVPNDGVRETRRERIAVIVNITTPDIRSFRAASGQIAADMAMLLEHGRRFR